MKVEGGLVSLKSKFAKPCRKLLRILKFRIRKPFSLKKARSRWFRRRPTSESIAASAPITPKSRSFSLPSSLSRLLKKMDRVRELRSVSDGADQNRLFPSPVTPSYVRARKAAEAEAKMEVCEVEDACRSFENYMVEMIIEEGKVRDLMDVEELLYCWRNLKCPVFVDLVSRFYGELCKDLFSSHN